VKFRGWSKKHFIREGVAAGFSLRGGAEKMGKLHFRNYLTFNKEKDIIRKNFEEGM